MSDSFSDLRYVMCPGSLPDPKFNEEYQKIYSCWRDVWIPALAEMGVHKHLNSDSFTRQDYIGAIFHKEHCVAMCFYRWTDAAREDFAQDSYFHNWSPEHLLALRSRGDKVIVCCQFTVHPEARGTKIGVSGKDLLMGMVIETFMHSQADAMTGAVRINRGVNKAGERWGGYVIARDVPSEFQGQEVDLIGFFKDRISQFPPHELSELTSSLWENRLHISRIDMSLEYQAPRRTPLKRVA